MIAAANDSDALVDYAQIDGLLEAAGRDGVAEILIAFWKSTDQLAEQLRGEIAAGSFVEAARTSHAVKGSAANVGAQLLANAARNVENCCKSQDAAGAVAAIGRLAVIYAQTRKALDARVHAAV